MTQGINYLSKVVMDQDTQEFNFLIRDWFTNDELRLLNYMQEHLGRYNALPTHDVLVAQGFAINQEVPQPLPYYRDELTHRYMMNQAFSCINPLNQAVSSSNLNQVRQIAMDLNRALTMTGNTGTELTTMQDACWRALEQARQHLERPILGYPTGWPELDALIGGYQRGDLHVIVGRISTGKTYVLLKSIYEAWRQGHSILLVTLEMSDVQNATRMLSIMAGCDPDHFKTGMIPTPLMDRMTEIVTTMHENYPPFHFLVAESQKSIEDVEQAIQRINPDVVYIDAGYLLASSTNSKKFKRKQFEEITDTMNGLKSLAVRTDKPIITTVQFNRTVKTNARTDRANQELSMEAIGGSDAIGQIAYSVLGIHPPIQGPTSRRTRILEVLKNRDGNVMKFKINFLFEPPNFDFIEEVITDDPEDEMTNEEAEAQASVERLGWM